MKKVLLISIFSVSAFFICSAQDTTNIYLNIAYFGESGSISEGLTLIESDGNYYARYVQYQHNNSINQLQDESIVRYFLKSESDYIVIKDLWKLDSVQEDLILSLLIEYKNFIPSKSISTAADFYLYKSNEESAVVIDKSGMWDFHKKLHHAIGIKTIIPRRLYFSGIKLKDQEVKYLEL